MNRYFVTVYARGADELRALQQHGLDLFAQTARKARGRMTHPYSIEGLLSLAEAETLVRQGCRVLLEDPVEARSCVSGQTAEFADWLRQMQPALKADKAMRR
jgi:hypothetical protein